eukprot:1185523-Prorocentrum_minimum.AAC.7
MAGSSREDDTPGGDLLIMSGGSGYDTGAIGWNGDSGSVGIISADPGYIGDSGEVLIGSGNATQV